MVNKSSRERSDAWRALNQDFLVFFTFDVSGVRAAGLQVFDWFSLLQKHEFREYWVSPFNELQKHIFAQQFTCSNRFQNHPYHSNTIIPPHWLCYAEKKEDLIVLTNLELFTFKAWANRCSKWFQWYASALTIKWNFSFLLLPTTSVLYFKIEEF